jgi:hypothetical protein
MNVELILTMAKLELYYHELMDRDYTGVTAKIISDSGEIVACYRNFDPDEEETYGNQTEEFEIPSVDVGIKMFNGIKNYRKLSSSEYMNLM